MQSFSKAWAWEIASDDVWNVPSEDSYYYVHRWKEKGFKAILDLGCGVGRHSVLFAQNDFKVHGVDLSEYAVSKTKEKLAELSLEGSIQCADVHELPFEDNKFDALFSYHVISHTNTLGIVKIINEMKRVVKPDGEMYFTLCSKISPSFACGNYEAIDQNTIIKNDGPEVNIPHYYSDENEVRSLLKDLQLIKMRHTKDYFENSFGWHFYILCKNLK